MVILADGHKSVLFLRTIRLFSYGLAQQGGGLHPFLSSHEGSDRIRGYRLLGRGKIAPRPQRRQFSEFRVAVAQVVRRAPFAVFNNIRSRGGGEGLHEQVDVIRLDVQLHDPPTLYGAFLFNEFAAVARYPAGQNRLGAFGGPDQVIGDMMHSLFIPLVVTAHVGSIYRIDKRDNNYFITTQ